jgi:hypothetical protein
MASTKKTPSVKKTPRKKGPKGPKKEIKRAGKNEIVFFMGKLVEAGFIGEEIPEESQEQRQTSMLIRRMAEQLARQTRKFGEDDVSLGEE